MGSGRQAARWAVGTGMGRSRIAWGEHMLSLNRTYGSEGAGSLGEGRSGRELGFRGPAQQYFDACHLATPDSSFLLWPPRLRGKSTEVLAPSP